MANLADQRGTSEPLGIIPAADRGAIVFPSPRWALPTPMPPLAVGQEPPPLNPRPPRERRPAAGDGGKPKGKAASRGRLQCINAFIDATMGELTLAERSVWLILWRDTKPNGLAETSQGSIARRAGISDRAVRSALRVLIGKGLVAVVRRGRLRRGPSANRVAPLARRL